MTARKQSVAGWRPFFRSPDDRASLGAIEPGRGCSALNEDTRAMRTPDAPLVWMWRLSWMGRMVLVALLGEVWHAAIN